MNENNVQFLPMIENRAFELSKGEWCTLDLNIKDKFKPLGEKKRKLITRECEVQDVIASIKKTQQTFTTSITHLMVFNEP